LSSRFKIDSEVYAYMLKYIDGFSSTEVSGMNDDAKFIHEDFWLQNTAVIENIEYRNGEWNIYLIFAHHLIPMKFIKRKIVNLSCPKKAFLTAHYMRRQAAKDQRGTLVLNMKLFQTSFS